MLALELEQALCRLEKSTETLLGTPAEDLVALCRALDDRADAITKVALLAETNPNGGAIERLASVLVQGEEATRRLLRTRRDAAREWTRLEQAQRALAPEAPDAERTINCRG